MNIITVDCHIYYNVAGFEHNIHVRTGEHAVDVRKLSWQRSWRFSETSVSEDGSVFDRRSQCLKLYMYELDINICADHGLQF